MAKEDVTVIKFRDGEIDAFTVVSDDESDLSEGSDLSCLVFGSVSVVDSDGGCSGSSGNPMLVDESSADGTTGTATVD